MKKFISLSWICISIIVTTSCTEGPGTPLGNTLAFTNAHVIPMDTEHILSNYTVIVRDGKIHQIDADDKIQIPANCRIINAEGKYLIPALSDMHIHLEGETWNMLYPPELKYTKDEIDFEDILFLYLANGITLVNVMSAFPEHIALRDSINNNKLLGPRLILSRMIDGPDKAWPPPISIWVNNPEEAKKAVEETFKMGYDRLKVYSFLDKASYDTIIASAKHLGLPVDGHIPFSVSVEHVLSSGQNMIAHSEELMKFANDYSPEQIEYYAGLVANSNTWLTATLITSHNLVKLLDNGELELTKPGAQYLHPMGEDIWSYIYENLYKPIPQEGRDRINEGYRSFQIPFVYAFHQKGGKLLAGTDALVPPNLPGYTLHDELGELVNAGLSNYEALKTSTTNAYALLGELESSGTIESEKMANFILLDKNPLENISNTQTIYGVFYHDQWITKKEIDARLSEIEERNEQIRKSKN